MASNSAVAGNIRCAFSIQGARIDVEGFTLINTGMVSYPIQDTAPAWKTYEVAATIATGVLVGDTVRLIFERNANFGTDTLDGEDITVRGFLIT